MSLLTPKEIERNKIFFPEPTAHDWQNDFKYENGNYTRTCIECTWVFRGHKRRLVCYSCATKEETLK